MWIDGIPEHGLDRSCFLGENKTAEHPVAMVRCRGEHYIQHAYVLRWEVW